MDNRPEERMEHPLPRPAIDRDDQAHPPNGAPHGDERTVRAEDTLWRTAGSLVRWRRFIIGVTTVVAVLAVIISLLLPKWYQGVAKVLLPESSNSGAFSAMLGDLGGAAASLLGVGGGDYTRYMAILNRRETLDATVDRFNLETVYETTESETSRYDARQILSDNIAVEIDMELDYLIIAVLDQDPQRAADMANFLVEELNRANADMVSSNASKYRQFVEQRYAATEAALDSALARLQAFQAKYGVVELEAQTEAFLSMMATYRAETILGEIEYEGLLNDFGENNPQVRAARSRVQAARQKAADIRAGRDALMPVSFDELPQMSREYAKVKGDVLLQAEVLKYARPLLEQAIFEEEMKSPAVQVLEAAEPPILKEKPKRSILVIAATLSGFLLTVLFVLVYEWWRRNHTYLASRLDRELNGASASGSP